MIKEKTKKILPVYGWIAVSAMGMTNFAVYFLSRLVNSGRKHYNMWMAADDYIPFISCFIIIYILAYVQWAAGFFLVGRAERKTCLALAKGDIIAKLICLACFVFIPTVMVRPQVTGGGLCGWLVRLIYRDPPDNLFPSIHCLESWFCFRCLRYLKNIPRWYSRFTFVFSVLVIASTVLVKQHVIVDIPAGILCTEIGLMLARRTISRD